MQVPVAPVVAVLPAHCCFAAPAVLHLQGLERLWARMKLVRVRMPRLRRLAAAPAAVQLVRRPANAPTSLQLLQPPQAPAETAAGARAPGLATATGPVTPPVTATCPRPSMSAAAAQRSGSLSRFAPGLGFCPRCPSLHLPSAVASCSVDLVKFQSVGFLKTTGDETPKDGYFP